jgi:hypothetical protein
MYILEPLRRKWPYPSQYVECDSIIISLRPTGSGSENSENKESNSGNDQSHSDFKDELA